MQRLIQYGILFITLALAQVFLLDSISISPYIYPIIYIGFLLLLPMETHPAAMLMLGVMTGVVTDVAMGTAGLNSIASILTAFIRPYMLTLTVGRADSREGGIPSPQRLGALNFFKYTGLAILIHCLVYFSFESLSWHFWYLTLLKAALSAIVTTLLVYVVALVLGNRN